MIEFRDVRLQYHYDEYELLKGVDFVLKDGTSTLLADVQSGKTSVCRLILKDTIPTSGEIFVDGRDICGITNANLDILYLPSKPVFWENRTVLYNIEYPLKVRKVAKSVRRREAYDIAQRLGIADLERKIRNLSADERKRVAIARGMTVPRKTVLWDDFFQSAEQIEPALCLFEGANHVIFTSDADIAQGHTVVLDGGKVVYQGDAESAASIAKSLQWLNDSIGRD